MKILIAEDDTFSRKILEKRLTAWGHEVISAEDGQAAFDIMMKDDAPKLAVLDWMMPGLDGTDVCIKIRNKYTVAPPYLILLTAKTQKEDIIEGLEAGANDYVTKPFDANELKARINVGIRVIKLQTKLNKKITELELAKAEIRQLKEHIPICSYCKNIRDENDEWHAVEHYIENETGSKFSHGICPVCMEKHLKPELEAMKKK